MSAVKRREADAKAKPVSRQDAQRASVAQLLLVARLRARNRRDLAVDTLERAAHVIFITCKNWFATQHGPRGADESDSGFPASGTADSLDEDEDEDEDDNNNKGPDAYRHH